MKDRTEWLAFLRQWPQHETLTESPIELALFRTFLKYLVIGNGVTGPSSGLLCPQVPLTTRAGTFRADFLLVAGGQITLVECDSAAFHTDPLDDHLRSAFILEAGLVDQVIRFNGSMLHHSPRDAALWTAAAVPAAFWAGAEASLARSATPEGVAALQGCRKELCAGYSHFQYDALVEDPRQQGEPWGDEIRRVAFEGTYHTAAPNHGTIGELIAILARIQASTLEELKWAYWVEVREREDRENFAYWTSVMRQKDIESGPFTREVFDRKWSFLGYIYSKQFPQVSPDAYFLAVSDLKYAAQFYCALNRVIRNTKAFPSPEELHNAANITIDDFPKLINHLNYYD